MTNNKKGMLIAAAVLLLTAALFVGAAAATDPIEVGTGAELQALIAIGGSSTIADDATVTLKNDIECFEGLNVAAKDFTLNLAGHTLTLYAPVSGQTYGIVLPAGKDVKIVSKDGTGTAVEGGTIAVTDGTTDIQTLIQSNGILTIGDKVLLDGTNLHRDGTNEVTVLSVQAGSSVTVGSAENAAAVSASIRAPKSTDVAFEIASGAGTTVTVNTAGTIIGNIKYVCGTDNPTLTITSGTIYGDLVIDTTTNTGSAAPARDTKLKIKGTKSDNTYPTSFTVTSEGVQNLIQKYVLENGVKIDVGTGQQTLLTLAIPESYVLVIPAAFNFVIQDSQEEVGGKMVDVYKAESENVGVTDIEIAQNHAVMVYSMSTNPTKWTLSNGVVNPYEAEFTLEGEDAVDMITKANSDKPFLTALSNADGKKLLGTMTFTQKEDVKAGIHTDKLTFTAKIEDAPTP